MAMKNHGGMINRGKLLDGHQSSLAVLPEKSSSNKSGGTWRKK
jgi:hypothetical protein